MPFINHYGTAMLWDQIAVSGQEEVPINLKAASTIASHWQSPHNEGLTALSTGHPAWEGMVHQIIAETVSELLNIKDNKPIGYRTELEQHLQAAELCALLVYLDGCTSVHI